MRIPRPCFGRGPAIPRPEICARLPGGGVLGLQARHHSASLAQKRAGLQVSAGPQGNGSSRKSPGHTNHHGPGPKGRRALHHAPALYRRFRKDRQPGRLVGVQAREHAFRAPPHRSRQACGGGPFLQSFHRDAYGFVPRPHSDIRHGLGFRHQSQAAGGATSRSPDRRSSGKRTIGAQRVAQAHGPLFRRRRTCGKNSSSKSKGATNAWRK